MLESLLSPQTIAVLGASRTPGKVGHEVVANLINGGYQGTIVPVNPKADEILGLKCYHDLKEYDGKVDLGIVVVPLKAVKDAIQSAIDAGAKAVVVITAGFKEVGAGRRGAGAGDRGTVPGEQRAVDGAELPRRASTRTTR